MPALVFYHEWKNFIATTANCNTDAFRLMLTSDAPVVGTDSLKADRTEISAAGGYANKLLTTTWAETGAGVGTWRLSGGADQTWTASGAAFDVFRYVDLYDDTVASDPLVGYWDYGSNLTLNDGDSFTVNLDANFALFELS